MAVYLAGGLNVNDSKRVFLSVFLHCQKQMMTKDPPDHRTRDYILDIGRNVT